MKKNTYSIRLSSDEIAALWSIMAKWNSSGIRMEKAGNKSEAISILIHNEFFNQYGSTIEEAYKNEEEGI